MAKNKPACPNFLKVHSVIPLKIKVILTKSALSSKSIMMVLCVLKTYSGVSSCVVVLSEATKSWLGATWSAGCRVVSALLQVSTLQKYVVIQYIVGYNRLVFSWGRGWCSKTGSRVNRVKTKVGLWWGWTPFNERLD